MGEQPRVDEAFVGGDAAAPVDATGGGAARPALAVGLQALVALAFILHLTLDWQIALEAMLLAVAGAYLFRNPLRHASALIAALVSLVILAPALYTVAGGVVWPGSPSIKAAVVAPTVGLGAVAVLCFVGLARQAVTMSRRKR